MLLKAADGEDLAPFNSPVQTTLKYYGHQAFFHARPIEKRSRNSALGRMGEPRICRVPSPFDTPLDSHLKAVTHAPNIL